MNKSQPQQTFCNLLGLTLCLLRIKFFLANKSPYEKKPLFSLFYYNSGFAFAISFRLRSSRVFIMTMPAMR